MMAPTDDLFFGCSYPSLEPPCFRRKDHLSQVWSRAYCGDLWVAPIGRLQAHLACRMSGLGSTPVPSSIAESRTAFRGVSRTPRISYSRLAHAGRLSSHRVQLNDPSNRAFLRHPVSPLASRPSEERELAPLVHIIQAALSLSAAHPKATPVAIRPLGEGLNPTKETSFASDNARDQ